MRGQFKTLRLIVQLLKFMNLSDKKIKNKKNSYKLAYFKNDTYLKPHEINSIS